MAIRAKFMCSTVTKDSGGNEMICCYAVYGKDGSDNAAWSKASPSGKLELTISNPQAQGFFTPGKEFFLDMAEATAEEKPAPTT